MNDVKLKPQFNMAAATAVLAAATAAKTAADHGRLPTPADAIADVPGVGPTRGAPLGHGARSGTMRTGKQPMPAQVTGPLVRGLMGAPRR